MTSMEKGTIKLTVKFPNQQIKDQKVILCASPDASKSAEPCSDSSESSKLEENTDQPLLSDSNLPMNDSEQHEETNKKEETMENTTSSNAESNCAQKSPDASTSTSSETPKKNEKANFSWDAQTFANISEQDIQNLNEYQRLWIQQAYQNYLAMHMYYYSTLGLNLPNNAGHSLPQNFLPYYNMRNNYTFRDIRSDQSQNAVDPQQNGTLNQDNQSNTNNNNNNNNNNVQNNNHGDDNPENLDNRDWLDNFYMLSRVIVLFSIVYFYSSPLRFSIVTILGVIILIYHHRAHQILQPNNENNAPANNGENNDPNPEDENQAPGNPAQNRPLSERESYNGTDRDEQNEERPGAAAVAWIFLSSFFASLIPD